LRAADDAEICDSIQLPHHTSKVAKGSPRTSILNFPERLVLASQPVDSSLSSIFFLWCGKHFTLRFCDAQAHQSISLYEISHQPSSIVGDYLNSIDSEGDQWNV
jgi:hypothetical protein